MEYNLLQLAFVGDAVYELEIRTYLINENIMKPKELKEKSLNFVSAVKQAYYLKKLIDNNFFEEEELEIIRRGRNTKLNSKPRNCDILTYHYATSFEVLLGYLFINNKETRIKEIITKIIEIYQA